MADDLGTLEVRYSVYNEWTRIPDPWEPQGAFLEAVAPGAFDKTTRENRKAIRAQYQHGKDPQVGSKPLGPITEFRSESDGAYASVRLLDTSYNRDLLPGLREGLYGASFRFKPVRDDYVSNPGPSAYNPDGLPERTIREARLIELGPVAFGAYPSAGASMRDEGEAPRDSIPRVTRMAYVRWLEDQLGD